MNKSKKDFMEQLNNLDDISVEEIAENYPALDEHSKKRILNKCMKKSGFSDNTDDGREEIVVSGTERYNRAVWYKYAASAAAFVIAVVGITSVVLIHRNLNGDEDFELENPPALSSYDSSADNISEQATTVTTKDKGYVAGGHDYANDSDYSGIIIGGTTQAPPAVDESSSGYTAEQGDTPVVNNNNNNNNTPVQPATQAPPVTAPPATQAPVTTAPPATEPVTDNATQSEAQKTYLSDLYYVEIEGVSGCMGFNFSLDGTLSKFAFNDYGNVEEDTKVTCSYEIVGNQFIFGDFASELNKKVGTIANLNDTGSFTVQFDDGLYYFNVGEPVFMKFKEEKNLAGLTRYGYSSYGERLFTFYDDGMSGNYINTQDGTGLSFTYFINGDEITFRIGDTQTVVTAEFIEDTLEADFAVKWSDGNIEYFYDGSI